MKVFFHQDTATVATYVVAIGEIGIATTSVIVIRFTPLWLFPKWKKLPNEERFDFNDVIVAQ